MVSLGHCWVSFNLDSLVSEIELEIGGSVIA